jgi:hypothetical protein
MTARTELRAARPGDGRGSEGQKGMPERGSA